MATICEGCGATVTSKFCADCGRPMGAVTGTVVAAPQEAAPAASATPERYDCWRCKDEKRPFKDTLNSHVHRTSDDDQEVRCAECLEQMTDGREYFECNTAITVFDGDGGSYTEYCQRRICRGCVDLRRNEREHSRFNHNEPYWKAPYCAADRYCLNAFLCSCNIFDSLKPLSLDDGEQCYDNGLYHCCALTAGTAWMPVQFAMNLVVLNFFGFLRNWEQPLTKRFGIEDRSCPERYFCSCCVNALYAREAALRGYEQQTLYATPCLVNNDEPRCRHLRPVCRAPWPSFENRTVFSKRGGVLMC